MVEGINIETCKPGDKLPDDIPMELPDWQEKRMLVNFLPDLLEMRADVNQAIVDFVIKKIPSNEKVAFFWGKGHSDNMVGERDLDELLSAILPGKPEVTNIAIYGSRAGKVCNDYLASKTRSGNDSQFFYYVLEKDIEQNKQHSEVPAYKSFDDYRAESLIQYNHHLAEKKGAARAAQR